MKGAIVTFHGSLCERFQLISQWKLTEMELGLRSGLTIFADAIFRGRISRKALE